jgi:cell division septum initiation protein DivIVA
MSAPTDDEFQFARVRHGYDPREVDDYLQRFAEYAAKLEDRAVSAESALEECGHTLAELRGRLQAATGAELSGRLAEILRLAEEEAHEIRARARAEARAMTEDAAREVDESRRATADERLRFDEELREIAAIRDRYLGDLRALGGEIMQATDRYEPELGRVGVAQEHLPDLDRVTGPDSVDDDANTRTGIENADVVTPR